MRYKHGAIAIDVNGEVIIPSNAIDIRHWFVGDPANACIQVSWLEPMED